MQNRASDVAQWSHTPEFNTQYKIKKKILIIWLSFLELPQKTELHNAITIPSNYNFICDFYRYDMHEQNMQKWNIEKNIQLYV